ncbi:hypothetical protein EON65_20175 [archaeon]|nr:MAG: hypothetical protein EON65_20175 [archaeon]
MVFIFYVVYYARAVKPPFILNPDLDAPEYFEAEFDDEEEYKDFYVAYTSQFISLVASLATYFLDIIVEVLCLKLQEIVSMVTTKQQEAELGAYVRLVGGMVEYIKENPDAASTVSVGTGANIIGLLDIVLSHEIFRSYLDEQIKLLSMLSTIPLDVTYVTKIMSYLFTLLSAPTEQVKPAVKEEAGRAFAKCMARYVGTLANFPDVLSSILTQMNNVLLNSPLSNDLQSSLRQSLLALLTSITAPADQEYVLNLCIQPYLVSLQQELLYFGQSFIGTLLDQSQYENNLQHFDTLKTSLRHLVSMLGKVDVADDVHKAKSLEGLYVVSPLYKYWTEVVQLVLNIMMQLFHTNLDLSHPSAYTQIIYAQSALEVNKYLPSVKVPYNVTPHVNYASSCKDVLGFCYNHLGLAAKHQLLYLYQPARQYVEEVFVKNLNNYDHGHFQWAAKFFFDKYMIYSYDFKHALHHHVLLFAKYFLQHVVYRVEHIFSQNNPTVSPSDKYIYSMQATDQLYGQVLASDQIELLKEQISIDVVRQSLEVLKSLLALSGMLVTGLPKDEGNKEAKEANPAIPPNLARLENIRLYVFNDILLNPQIMPVFFQTLRLLLLIGDSAVASSVLQVCSMLVNVEVLKTHGALVDFVGREMFSVLLFAMLRQVSVNCD